MRSEGVEKVERYSSGGKGLGIFGLVVVAAIVAYGVIDRGADFQPWFIALCLLFGAIIWASLVRPALVLHEDELELRNIVHDRWVPYARITDFRIDQVTIVFTDEGEKYVGAGFGRSRRMIRRDGAGGVASGGLFTSRFASMTPADDTEKHSLGWLIQDKVRRNAAGAVEKAELSPEIPVAPARGAWAWPQIVILGGLALVTVVLAIVG
ncbi:hypothetical protein GCM10022237_18500 [Nocardioides ginsengisoli]